MNSSTSNPRGQQPAGVSPILALVMATISFFALTIMGLGILAVVTDKDMIETANLGPAPVVAGMVAAVLTFAAMLWGTVRQDRPTYPFTFVIGLAAALAHLLGVALGALLSSGDIVRATATSGGLLAGGASLVLLSAALIAAWGGVALRRTRASAPHWPWEDES